MRTLFGRVLLWYLGLIVVMTGGFYLMNRFREPSVPPELGTEARQRLLETAVETYQAGGPDGLRLYLDDLAADLGIRAIATDPAGRDLVDGSDRSGLVESARSRTWPWVSDDSGFFLIATDAGGSWMFFGIPDPTTLFAAQYVLMLAVAIGLCYVLARHLTAPLQSLRHAVERFGAGELRARLNSSRRDELGQLARTFDAMADRIQSLVAGQQNLLCDISHELRSPLTRLRLAVDLGRAGGDKNEAYDRIEREAQRLDSLVGELLAWARYDTGFEAGASEVRLDRMLEDLCSLYRLEAEEKLCQITVESHPAVRIWADQEALRRAIENVLRNAVHFAPRGSAVTLSLETGPTAFEIRIRDFGPGVPEESLASIFEAFHRVDSDRSRDTGGVGLGLAIAARAVEAHQGVIHARNAHPGLEVSIRLPRSLEVEPNEAPPTHRSEGQPAGFPTGGVQTASHKEAART